MIITTFILALALFVAIGLLSTRHQQRDSIDYLLAGRSIPPSLVALSAVATNNSGYMFIGMIGYTYATGLSSIWMMIGWIIGDLIASLLIHRPVRELSGRHHLHTYSALLSHRDQQGDRLLRGVVGLLTLVFLGTYAAAQLSAGSKALQALFDWEAWSGAVIGAVIVLLYSLTGGIRASIWTDAAQSVVMIVAMVMMVLFGLDAIGGWGSLSDGLKGVGDGYDSLMPAIEGFAPLTGFAGFLLGWLFAGYGVAGQPHIMIRFMTMADPADIGRVRLYYYLWFTLFFGLTILAALCARLLLPDTATFDAELALPTLAIELLPPVLTGLVLAGIFAATISTADSLILSCSASLTRDFHHQKIDHLLITRGGTLLVTIIALMIALKSDKSVFALVLDAWGVLGAAFAPLITLIALGRRPDSRTSIAMIISGVATVYWWPLPGWSYAIFPGIVAGFLVYLLLRPFQRMTAASRQTE